MRIPSFVLFVLAVFAGCTTPVDEVQAPEPIVAEAAQAPADATPRLLLGEPRRLTDAGGYMGPAWSPGGDWVSFTGGKYRGLYRVAATGGEVETLAGPDQGSWFRHGWADGPLRVVRDARGSLGAAEVVIHTGAVRERTDAVPSPVVVRDDQLWVIDGDGEHSLTHGEDRFFDPVVSPDGRYVAVVGMSTGIHLLDLQTRLAVGHGGRGTHPTWSSDSAWVVYERTADDGNEVTGADLWALPLQGEAAALTRTAGAQEMDPAIAPDGTRLAFVRGGAIWVAALDLEALR